MLKNIIDPKKLVLLDRDGVINFDSDNYVKHPDEWIPIPGSLESITKLNKLGIHVCVITNQSGVGRGLFSLDNLHAMHLKMERLLASMGGHISKIYFCSHVPSDNCICRKPKPGLLNNLEKDFNISLNKVPFIGDSETDIELAHKKNCLPILVKTGKGSAVLEKGFSNSDFKKTTLVFDNLEDASEHLLAHHFNIYA